MIDAALSSVVLERTNEMSEVEAEAVQVAAVEEPGVQVVGWAAAWGAGESED